MSQKHLEKINNRILILINVILGQTFLACFMATYQRVWASSQGMLEDIGGIPLNWLVIVATIILTATAVWLIRVTVDMALQNTQAQVNQARLQEAQEFIEVLRSHRHDFLNHMQVVSGLIDIGRADKAKGYIAEMAKEINEEKKLKLVEHPELNALFIKKWAIAEVRDINISVDCTTTLEGMDLPSHELIRLMGNLLENALQAVGTVEPAERRVQIKIWETEADWCFSVYNWRPVIPAEIQAKVFERGFSTKGERGRGLGLDIVSTIVKKHEGKVALVSEPDTGTIFAVTLPKQQTEAVKLRVVQGL